LRVRVHGRDGQMAVDVAHPVAQLLLQLLDIVVDQPAMRALIVAVFDQCDRAIGWSLEIVPLADWHDKSSSGSGCFARHNYVVE
jgi:hypothetical protein